MKKCEGGGGGGTHATMWGDRPGSEVHATLAGPAFNRLACSRSGDVGLLATEAAGHGTTLYS